jgi:hypothetical protein
LFACEEGKESGKTLQPGSWQKNLGGKVLEWNEELYSVYYNARMLTVMIFRNWFFQSLRYVPFKNFFSIMFF